MDLLSRPAYRRYMKNRRLKQPREAGEIQRKFEHQLRALRASAKAFDEGDQWEAERISTAVQTICHSAGQTSSLLDQLGLNTRFFADSADPFNPANKLAHCTLVSLGTFNDGSVSFISELDNRPMIFVPFNEWWNAPVLTTGADAGEVLSRQQLTQIMRNQDGGSHVDPTIDAAYAGMREAMNFSSEERGLSTRDGELFAMRQIGHELLKSLVPTYRKRPFRKNELTAVWRSLTFEEGPGTPKPERPPYNLSELHEPCPCGSQIVFRACHFHGAQDPEIFESTESTVVAPPEAAFGRLVLHTPSSPQPGEGLNSSSSVHGTPARL